MIKANLEKMFPEAVVNEKNISNITAIYVTILHQAEMTPHFPEFRGKVTYADILRVGTRDID